MVSYFSSKWYARGMDKKSLLGIDYGSVRVGTAYVSADRRFAFPYQVFANDAQLLTKIVELIQTEQVATVVIGDSRDFAGKENEIMSRAKAFGDALKKKTGCEVVYENETLTSAQARRAHEQKEKTRKPQGNEVVDAGAAALILQAYLDKQDIVT
jgi:putative Holliday junction resolvase